jgi:hypothetical protein
MNFKYPDLASFEPGKTLLCPLLTPNLERLVADAKKRCPLHPFAAFCFDPGYFFVRFHGELRFSKAHF